jgi:hypothetical protein
MATNTANYNIRKPDPIDEVDVATDLGAPYDTIDSNLKRVDDAALAAVTSRWNRQVDQAGTLFTTSGATEADVAKLQILSIPIVLGTTYHFRVKLLGINPSVAGDDFQVRVRRTTAVSGPELSKFPNFIRGINLDHPLELHGFWVSTVNATESFFVSIARAFGTGVVSINGDGFTQFEMWTDPPTVTNTVKVT